MKKYLGISLLLLLCACTQREGVPVPPDTDIVMRLVSPEPPTKSILTETEAAEQAIHTVSYAVYEHGSGLLMKKGYVSYEDLPEEKVKVLHGRSYAVYLLANLGDQRSAFPPLLQDMEDLSCTLPSFALLDAGGIPMAGSGEYNGSGESVLVPLHRLLARVRVEVDHQAMGSTGMRNETLHLRNVARVLYPFDRDGSRARSSADIYTEETDVHIFPAGERLASHSSLVTLYVPENRQGILAGAGLTQADKIPAGKEALCTYLEFSAYKDGSEDGVSGPVLYRVYLGDNEFNDFSVCGNRLYHASLTLSWNGLFLEGDWRITRQDGWNDARRLQFLNAQGQPLTELTVYQSRSADVYTFFTNGTDDGQGILGAKDLSVHPYGWQLRHSGAAITGQEYGFESGLTANFADGASAGTLRCGKLSFSAPASAPDGLTVELDMATLDGQVLSDPLTVTVRPLPVEGRWKTYEPHFIAQKGILRAMDAASGLPMSGYQFVTTDTDKIRISPVQEDGSVTVSTLFPGTASIQILNAQGILMDEVSLNINMLPWSVPSQASLYVDGEASISLLPPVFKLASADAEEAVGTQLDRGLIAERLFPIVPISKNDLIEGEGVLGEESLLLHARLKTFEGLPEPSGERFAVDDFLVVIPNLNMTAGNGTLYAYNPFRYFTSVTQFTQCLNDYSLYRRPSGTSGWNYSGVPDNDLGDTRSMSPFVLASAADHVQLAAEFDNAAGEVGAIAQGTPGTVSAGGTPSSWNMRLSLRNVSRASYSAGSISVFARVCNPVDGSVLSQKIASGYIRLHLYVWGRAQKLNTYTLRLYPVLSATPDYPEMGERVLRHVGTYPVGTRFNSSSNFNDWLDISSITPVDGETATCRLGSLGSIPTDATGYRNLLNSIEVPLRFVSQTSTYWYATDEKTLYFDPSENVELYLHPGDGRGMFVLHICDHPLPQNQGWYWD